MPSTFAIGGSITVNRLGYGAMQLTGPGVWGPPADRDQAHRVLRRAAELGVTFFDTADSYGPEVSEQLIAEALHPYSEDVVIATKAGFARTGPGQWRVLGFPEYLTQQCELSLRRLRLDAIDLFQLHRIDQRVPLEDQLGALVDLQTAGKIRHIGLSEVTVSQLQAALSVTPIATVQNLFNVGNRTSEPLLQECEALGIGFIPWYPIDTGRLASQASPLTAMAAASETTPAQLALAWLLHRSPVLVPIPGTSSLGHLEENCRAAGLTLDDATLAVLDAIDQPGADPEQSGQRVRHQRERRTAP